MDLCKLANFDGGIIIQSHDVPDGDTIGAGFALLLYLKSLGKEARMVYGGKAAITKPSLLMFIKHLNIPLEYAPECEGSDDTLIITADCQYGAGNVSKIPCRAFAVIDHHRPEIEECENVVIRPQLGSCCTLMWDLIRQTSFDIENCAPMRDALYYGLYTDTNGLSECRHALDRDLADIRHDVGMMKMLKNLALTLPELEIVSDALKSCEQIGGVGLFRAAMCDPNVLGFTSDIAIQVEGVDCCVVYSPLPFGLKLSVRSGVREMMASEVAAFLAEGVGSGGGTIDKAGAFLNYGRISEASPDTPPEEYLLSRIKTYIDYYEHYYAGNTDVAFKELPLFRKLPLPVRYAKTTDIFTPRTLITMRTLEGDVDIECADDTYLMIGILGEVYPIHRDKFEKTYIVKDAVAYKHIEYQPSLINRATGERKYILPFSAPCVPTGEKLARAMELTKPAKVFTAWDLEKYYAGSIGDYLVAPDGDYADCYIVRKDIFEECYEAAN